MSDDEVKFSILVVDDQDHARLSHQLMLERLLRPFAPSELNIKLTGTIEEMYEELKADQFHLVLIDRDLGRDSRNELIDGLDHIEPILEIQPTTKVIMVTGNKDSQLAVKALKKGALDFIVKGNAPHEEEYKKKQVLKAIQDSRIELRNLQRSISEDTSTKGYVCKSKAMMQVENQLHAFSYAPTPVLILGESGLGKTHAAKRLHELSQIAHKQKKRPFANVNISAIPEGLIDSELFGYEKGAFTGAKERTQGLFEKVYGGDLFLDEIGDASPQTQVKLLKVIDERVFKRVGGTQELRSNVRLIFATNKDLEAMVKEGTFREDLYARICHFTIQMPSLKDRKEDIPQICQNITDQLSLESAKKISFADFPDPLQKFFVRKDFPFNIRGIKGDLEQLLIYCPVKEDGKLNYTSWRSILKDSKRIQNESIQTKKLDDVLDVIVEKMGTKDWPGFKELGDRLEEKLCKRLLNEVSSNKERARLLGMSEGSASLKIKRYKRTKTMELEI